MALGASIIAVVSLEGVAVEREAADHGLGRVPGVAVTVVVGPELDWNRAFVHHLVAVVVAVVAALGGSREDEFVEVVAIVARGRVGLGRLARATLGRRVVERAEAVAVGVEVEGLRLAAEGARVCAGARGVTRRATIVVRRQPVSFEMNGPRRGWGLPFELEARRVVRPCLWHRVQQSVTRQGESLSGDGSKLTDVGDRDVHPGDHQTRMLDRDTEAHDRAGFEAFGLGREGNLRLIRPPVAAVTTDRREAA